MGNDGSQVDVSNKNVPFKAESIQIRKYNGKYCLKELTLNASQNINNDLKKKFYHRITGVAEHPPIFKDTNITSHCCVIRKSGYRNSWHDTWSGEVQPLDQFIYQCRLPCNEELNEMKSKTCDKKIQKQFKKIELKFFTEEQWLKSKGQVILQLTFDEYWKWKAEKTRWCEYVLTIPKDVILKAFNYGTGNFESDDEKNEWKMTINHALVSVVCLSKYQKLDDLPGAKTDGEKITDLFENKFGFTVLKYAGDSICYKDFKLFLNKV
eukprot:318043_1